MARKGMLNPEPKNKTKYRVNLYLKQFQGYFVG